MAESQKKSFVQDFLDKTATVHEPSQLGKELIDLVRIMDALGFEKEGIKSLIKTKVNQAPIYFRHPPVAL